MWCVGDVMHCVTGRDFFCRGRDMLCQGTCTWRHGGNGGTAAMAARRQWRMAAMAARRQWRHGGKGVTAARRHGGA